MRDAENIRAPLAPVSVPPVAVALAPLGPPLSCNVSGVRGGDIPVPRGDNEIDDEAALEGDGVGFMTMLGGLK